MRPASVALALALVFGSGCAGCGQTAKPGFGDGGAGCTGSAPPCPLQLGVCAGSHAHCTGDGWAPCGPADYGPAYAPDGGACDGLDHACSGQPAGTVACGGACCAAGSACIDGVCRAAGPSCTSSADCENDSFCDDGGSCVPWPDGGSDPACVRPARPVHFSPSIRCAWPPPDGSGGYLATPDPQHIQLITTPLVADFGTYPGPHPLLVFPTQNSLGGGSNECVGTSQYYGLLRILDPQSCQLVATLDAADQHVIGSSTPAIGDLNGDGRPDIVAASVGGGLVAFTYAGDAGWQTLWHSTEPDGGPSTVNAGNCEWAGPSIADVNGDGLPEVVYGGVIHDHTGRVLGESLGMIPYAAGQIPVLANVDLDGGPELVTGDHVYTFSAASNDWVAAPYFQPSAPLADGFVAVARFGSFPPAGQTDPGYPQIAVVGGGSVRVQTIDGRIVFGPYDIPDFKDGGAKGGGPPTIGDFNGDGQPDIAAASYGSYGVFSFHCVPPDGGTLPADCFAPGVLWAKPSQDFSSDVTGSSLFDFTGAGTAFGVYADECFARVYDGKTGQVVYSQWHSSCTWYENPIVADVLANYSSQLVVGSNQNCGIDCASSTTPDPQGRPVDAVFDGLPCATAADCPSAAATCAGGLCRCTSDDDCCGTPGQCPAQGFVCAPPSSAGNPSLGDTCRAVHGGAYPGIRVYADAQNRWMDSRSIWNQHAYSVTNVNDDGTIPAASAVKSNWSVPGLNDFRENVQGSLQPLSAPDLTVTLGSSGCDGGVLAIDMSVCDRGSAGVAPGVPVAVYAADGGEPLCVAATPAPIGPGQCEAVGCAVAPAPAGSVPVVLRVDPDGGTDPCAGGSGHAAAATVGCTSFE